MGSLDKAIVAHIDVNGKRFEILVDSELGYMYKVGKKNELNNVLVVEEVFENYRKGERHKEAELQKAFGTTDINKIAERILKTGEIQLTTDQRRKMQEEKRVRIVAILARECVDPRTGAPHPPQRIERAMEEARIQIDPFKDAEVQLEEILKKLKILLPLKFEKVRIAVRVPVAHAQRSYGVLKEFHMVNEEWQNDGSLIAVCEMPAGMQADFFDRINKLTSGQVETKIIKK